MNTNIFARKQRQKNAGGVFPSAISHAVTLAILLAKLANVEKPYRAEITIVALYLWLTGQMSNIKNVNDIPDVIRLSGSTPCAKNAFRNFNDKSEPWCEYSRPCKVNGTTVYLWQPIPIYLRKLFQNVISTSPYETPLLNSEAKARLFSLLTAAWKTPESLEKFPRKDKDTFANYFSLCALADNTIGAITRSQMINEDQLHHRSASYYQKLESDRIRAKIFKAQNNYLKRVLDAARSEDKRLLARFVVYTKSQSFSLLASPPRLANYLADESLIAQYELDTTNGRQTSIISPSITVGSRRVVESNEVYNFTIRLHQRVTELRPLGPIPTRLDSERNADWLDYYNAATERIALLFILLTGVRPTHSVTIEWTYYLGSDIAYVKDKGKLRPIYLCRYLIEEIQHYLTLQFAIRSALPEVHTSTLLWFYIDSNGQHVSLSNASLRKLMRQIWPGVVPYQLRHFFAQCAATSPQYRLLDQDIDRLMGHSNFGEHLGSDNIFPATVNKLMNYLNSIPVSLGLKEMHYV